MDDLNSYILQQVIKKKSNLEEGTPNDHKKQKKHVKRLVQFVGLVSNNQASVSINDDQDYRHFDLVITPKEGPYCDAEITCLLYTSPSPRDATLSRMPSSA